MSSPGTRCTATAAAVMIGLWSLTPGLVAAAGPPCTLPAADCQSPDQLGHGAGNAVGAASDANPQSGYAARDNIYGSTTGVIDSVCWWGFYVDFDLPGDCGPGGVADSFTITYFENVAGIPPSPGAIKAGPFDVTATVTKAATGAVIPSAFGDLAEYEYTATHSGVALSEDECTWIQIRNDTSGSAPACIWLWSTAPSAAEGGVGDGLSWQGTLQNDFDLAFCVSAPLGDPASCTLQIDPGCVGAVNPCSSTSSQPGCADQECCSIVCQEVPPCCLTAWSGSCVSLASDLCGMCGQPTTGNCYSANFTPYCNDSCGATACIGCCQSVCAFDPFCCDATQGWDGFCSFEAQQVCSCAAGSEPPNDDCADAIAISLGGTPIDNTCGVAGPPSHATCNDGFLVGLGIDIWYTYTADFTGQLLVSTCGQADYDTQLAVYEGCDCQALGDPPLACNNNGAVCQGGTSVVVTDVVSGTCYLIRVGSSFVDPSGTGTLTLSQQIPPACDISGSIPPGAIAEGEPCGDNNNGGCDNPDPMPPAFTPIQLGDTVHGLAWAVHNVRDTDWYELVITSETDVTMTVTAAFPAAAGFAKTIPAGSGDCADATGFVVPSFGVATCETASITTTLSPGTWWPFVAPDIGDGLPCPVVAGVSASNDYVMTVAVACPWDCGDANGTVSTADFLALLSAWGTSGSPCEFGQGGPLVDTGDFLDLLSHWGPCPQQ